MYEGSAHARAAAAARAASKTPRGERRAGRREPARGVLSRLGSTFVSTKDSDRDRLRVLCVTHGGFIMEAMNAATGADGCTVPFCSNGAWNTSVWKVELTRNDKGKLCCRVVGANDASHLDSQVSAAWT